MLVGIIQENDLYFEIIDPATGQPVPEGEYGEIVFTTLTERNALSGTGQATTAGGSGAVPAEAC